MTEIERKLDLVILAFMLDYGAECVGKNPGQRRQLRMSFAKEILLIATDVDLPWLSDYAKLRELIMKKER